MTAIVVDTSAILASLDEAYSQHRAITALIEREAGPFVVSPMIVTEADYMLFRRLGAAAARRFAADIVSEAYELAEWAAEDHARALGICDRYSDEKDYLGMADASNAVLADRYRTTRILTLDQRHFRALQPLWGAEHFVILPYDA